MPRGNALSHGAGETRSSFARPYGSKTRPHTVGDGRKFADAKLPAAVSIPSSSPARKILRFAVFEVDLAAGELRKNGTRIRLQEQPFQILVYLLDRAGDVVTREELRQKLWPADTFVDFDHSLNTAINKLREALGDSASSPRYVETLARRGYRFLAPAQSQEANPTAQSSPTAAPREAAVTATTQAASFHPDLEVPLPRRSLTRALFGLVQSMYLIFYVNALFRLGAIDRITSTFLPGWEARAIFVAVLVTAGVGIPLRCYLISAVAFDHQGLGDKFRRLFPVILALDQLWAVAPFLLAEKIGFGAAFAATAALLYVPFSERTLVQLAYRMPPAGG
jgi:cholera toxin transcriptional activator